MRQPQKAMPHPHWSRAAVLVDWPTQPAAIDRIDGVDVALYAHGTVFGPLRTDLDNGHAAANLANSGHQLPCPELRAAARCTSSLSCSMLEDCSAEVDDKTIKRLEEIHCSSAQLFGCLDEPLQGLFWPHGHQIHLHILQPVAAVSARESLALPHAPVCSWRLFVGSSL